MTDSTRHMVAANATLRHKCATLLVGGNPTAQETLHQGSGMLHECVTGHWFCSECRAQFQLMEWGYEHGWPTLSFTNAAGRPATLSRGEYMWLKLCQLSGKANVEAALEAARKAQP